MTSKNVVAAYLDDDDMRYDFPDGNGKKAKDALYSLGPSKGDKGWTSLISYWEPFNPDQWSNEWSDTSIGENRFGCSDRMDPGAGYWIYSQGDYGYAYSTVSSGSCED